MYVSVRLITIYKPFVNSQHYNFVAKMLFIFSSLKRNLLSKTSYRMGFLNLYK